MKDFNDYNTASFTKAPEITPKAFDYASDFAGVSNVNGKAVIRNTAAPTNVEAQVTIQVQDIEKGLYKSSPYKNVVTNPQAKGRSLFIKLDKTSDNEATGIDHKIIGESVYLCYRSELTNWSETQVIKAIEELLGILYEKSGNSRVAAMLKSAVMPKDC